MVRPSQIDPNGSPESKHFAKKTFERARKTTFSDRAAAADEGPKAEAESDKKEKKEWKRPRLWKNKSETTTIGLNRRPPVFPSSTVPASSCLLHLISGLWQRSHPLIQSRFPSQTPSVCSLPQKDGQDLGPSQPEDGQQRHHQRRVTPPRAGGQAVPSGSSKSRPQSTIWIHWLGGWRKGDTYAFRIVQSKGWS